MKKILKITSFLFVIVNLLFLTSCLLKKTSVNLGGSNSSTREIYTINYNYNNYDGTLIGSKTTEFIDCSSVVLPTMSKTGYTFDGWYEGNNKIDKITENRDYDLTPKFTHIIYTISYNLNGGSMTTPYKTRDEIVNDYMIDFNNFTNQNLSVNDYKNLGSMEKINLETNFLYEHFDKWQWLASYISTVCDSSNESAWTKFMLCNSLNELNSFNENFIYSIAYELRGFIGGFKYTKNENFPSEDYSKYDINEELFEFIPITTFKITTNTINISSLSEFYFLQKEGYVFDGWYTNDSLTDRIDEIRVGSHCNLTLYAKWNPIYTYTFHSNGGVFSNNSTLLSYEGCLGEEQSIPSVSYDGYVFEGWYLPNSTEPLEINNNKFIFSGGNANYVAKWKKEIITISFNSNGGSDIESIQLKSGEFLDFASIVGYIPIREGYTFGGWYDINDNSYSIITYDDLSEDLILYAKWIEIPSHTVSFNSNGGSDIESIQLKSGDYIDFASVVGYIPIREGYEFGGWYDNAEYDGDSYSIITYDDLSEDLILYAKWNPKMVTINLTLNGGTLNTSTVIQGYIGEDVYLPRPSKEGLDFSGWYNSETDEFVDVDYIFPNEDVSLYATYGYRSYGEFTNNVTFVANKDYYIAVSDSMTNEDKLNSCSGVLSRLGSFDNSINSDIDGLYLGWYSPNGDENFVCCLDLDGIFNDMDVFAYLTFVSDEDGFDLYKFSFTEEQINELKNYSCDILLYEDTEFYDLIHFVLE